MEKIAFRYQAPEQLSENLWSIRGEWSNKLGRRMTVIRLPEGGVAIHNAIRLHTADLDWLRSLGRQFLVIAPNVFHCSDAGWMVKNLDGALLYVPDAKLAHFRSGGFAPLSLSGDFPERLSGDLLCIPMEGTRIEEYAFLHHASRTLILCDLAFHMEPVFSGLEKIFMDWNRVGGRFGPSRLTRWLFSRDRNALRASYQRLLGYDFDRVIVNHGAVLESGGRDLLRSSVEEIFG